MQTRHISVLRDAVCAALAPRDGAIYVDATFGGGGYSSALLMAAECSVIAVDRDSSAIVVGEQLAQTYPNRLYLREGKFSQLEALIGSMGHRMVDGVCFDIGVSSMQLDDASRGFSFMHSGPLDMRMGDSGVSAADIINDYDEDVLARIIAAYGEEKKARMIARAIIRARTKCRITHTHELAEIVCKTIGGRHKSSHPATRVFQALRIFINDELGELIAGLHAAERVLRSDACLAIVSFHSLEDRIVKRFLAHRAGRVSRGSRHFPELTVPTASFSRPMQMAVSDEEIALNPRARSGRLRFAYRTDAEILAPLPIQMLMPPRLASLHAELQEVA